MDIFSFGLVAYELLTYERRVWKTIMTSMEPVVFPVPARHFQPLIDRCVSMNADERPTAIDVDTLLGKFESGFWTFVEDQGVDQSPVSIDGVSDDTFNRYYNSVADTMLAL